MHLRLSSVLKVFIAISTAWIGIDAFTVSSTTQTHTYGVTSSSSSSLSMVRNSVQDEMEIPLRFLGKGERAVVRPGVVLIAPNHEYNHFLMRSAVFIHAIGLNEYNEHVTRGVIIDHPTAFTMGEMGGGSVSGNLAHSVLFQGGDNGNDSVMLLHSAGSGHHDDTHVSDDGTTSSSTSSDADADADANLKIHCGEMIGTSGIYEGGLYSAMDLVDDGVLDPDRFKFFFNYVEFSDAELEGMLSATDSEGDAWASMEVPTRVILDNDFDRGECWSYLRIQMKQMLVN